MRGDGRVFRYRGSRFYWMAYSINGKEVRESTKETEEIRARKVLRRTVAEVLRGDAVPHESRVTLRDLCEVLTTDYETNGRRSLKTLRYSLQHLLEFFGPAAKAACITTDRIQQYIAARQREGASTATMNIELSLLGRASRWPSVLGGFEPNRTSRS